MASASNDPRRTALSPKPKGRENAKDTLCRNVTIYGHCRYEDKGCAFNHDPSKGRSGNMGSSGKRLNVDSPSFTPTQQHATLAIADPNRASGLSPKAANAAPFKPKGLGSGIDFNPTNNIRKTYNPNAPDWTSMGINGEHDFLPHAHALQNSMPEPQSTMLGDTLFDDDETPVDPVSSLHGGDERGADQQDGNPGPPRESHTQSHGKKPHKSQQNIRSKLTQARGPDGSHQASGSARSHKRLPRTTQSEFGHGYNGLPARGFVPNPLALDFQPRAGLVSDRRPSSISFPDAPQSDPGTSSADPKSKDFYGPARVDLRNPLQHLMHNPLNPANHTQQSDPNSMQNLMNGYTTPTGLMGHSPGQQHIGLNPYSHDIGGAGSMYNGSAPAYVHPVQFHLMRSSQPTPKNVTSNQRVASQFFSSEQLREELHRKMEATQQRLDNSGLPPTVDHFWGLVPLDKVNQRNTAIYGYASWVYKVFSMQDGKAYTLRRIEGYKLTTDKAITAYKKWKEVSNPNVVVCHEIFTTRNFNDTSLMFQTAFYPNAKTLTETHQLGSRMQNRAPTQHVPEAKLWQYMVQIANALRSIHGAGLAARIIDPSKILVTSPDQIRLNACGVKDVLDFGVDRSLIDLQKDDFKQFGRLIVALGTNKSSVQASLSNALDHFNRSYSSALKERVYWLINQPPDKTEGIEQFLAGLANESFKALSTAQSRENAVEAELQLSINNDFSFRTLMKLSTVVDHPSRGIQYPNNGDRDPLKLLRDYIFHPVDETGKPVVDLARTIDCLQKLDAGVDEKIQLTSRDNQIIIVVSFRELKQSLRSQYDDIWKQRNAQRIT